MAISRQANVMSKVFALTSKATLTTANVQLALDNWKNPDFPRKLEAQVRAWFKERNRAPELQAQYAPLDERSASILRDPCVEAQNAIIKLGDEDDLALMASRAVSYTEVSSRLWKVIAEGNTDLLPARTLTKLCLRDDIPTRALRALEEFAPQQEPKPSRRTRSAAAEEKPATTRRRREAPVEEAPTRRRRSSEAAAKEATKPTRRARKVVEEEPVRRGRTGTSKVVKPKVREVPKEYDLDDDQQQPRSAKTVKKVSKPGGAIAMIRKVVSPAKKTVRRSANHEEVMDEKKVRNAARTVRRPRM